MAAEDELLGFLDEALLAVQKYRKESDPKKRNKLRTDIINLIMYATTRARDL